MDPKYVKMAQDLAHRAMADAMYDGHMDWMSDPRLRTPEQLEQEAGEKERAAAAGLTLEAYAEEIKKREKKIQKLRRAIAQSAKSKVGAR